MYSTLQRNNTENSKQIFPEAALVNLPQLATLQDNSYSYVIPYSTFFWLLSKYDILYMTEDYANSIKVCIEIKKALKS